MTAIRGIPTRRSGALVASDPAESSYTPLQQRTNGLSVAGLVLGIVWLWGIGSILALVFGYVAKGQIDRSNGLQTGRGMAVASIVLGWVGVGVSVLVIVALLRATPATG